MQTTTVAPKKDSALGDEDWHTLLDRLNHQSVHKHFDAYADIDWNSEELRLDPEDPRWAADQAMRDYKAGMREHQPDADPEEAYAAYGWTAASTMIEALRGMEEPTREALMDSVRNMDAEIPLLLPGIRAKTSPTDGYPIQANQIIRFNGRNWETQGEVVQTAGN